MKKGRMSLTAKTFVFVCALFVLTFSTSYAFFTVKFTDERTEEDKNALVTTDYLDVNYVTSRLINNERLPLVKESEVATKAEYNRFTVSKKEGRTYGISFEVYLTELSISDNLKSEDFKWELLKTGSALPLYSGDFTTAKTGERFLLTADPIELIDVHSGQYDLRIYLLESDKDQTGLLGGTFSAKIGIDVVTVARADRS